MERLTHHELTVLFTSLAVLLLAARVLGEVARRLHQPAVLGEILAGVILGPTVLGLLAPDLHAALFPGTGANAAVLDGLAALSIALFLLVAGMEVDLSTMWRQGKPAIWVGTLGIVAPFAIGFGAAWTIPELLGIEAGASRSVFALFVATALSISALPVIAKTLLDLNLYRTALGMVVMPAAVFQDLAGWTLFAIVLGLMGAGTSFAVGETIGLTLVFVVLMLTLGRYLINRSLPWIQAHLGWPGGVLGFALVLALVGSAFTEWIGIHAIFGAFFVGIALGDSAHLHEKTRFTIDSFVSFFFAPLFFASIGLHVDFAAHFDAGLVLIVLVIAIAGKLIGCTVGARLGGLGRRESYAVASAMNARGAMEIILGLLALQAGVIGEPLFVALVVMALVTSMIAGPLIQLSLGERKKRRFSDYLNPARFLPELQGTTAHDAIRELVQAAIESEPGLAQLDPQVITEAVYTREDIVRTGVGRGVAVPHARLPQLEQPVVSVGLSRAGYDFDAPDGEPARLICLLLLPTQDETGHINLIASAVRGLAVPGLVKQATRLSNYTQFLALLNVERNPEHP